jgi:cell wall-associated NlpC family hydrolase
MTKLFLLSATLLLAACSTTHHRPSSGSEVTRELTAAERKILFDDIPGYARSLIGTPYKYGGSSPDTGFDCSGFVGDVFRHTAGVRLPRTTSEISKTGTPVKLAELRSGDLVFFNTLKRKFSHVGIYLENDTFIHAPSKSGKVRIENMYDEQWKNSFDGARRITLPH